MRPVRIPRPFPHVESESLLLLSSHRALEVNCRSTCSLSTCPALSHVSFLSFEDPAPRETSVVSVCSSDQGTTHQPDSLTRCSTASSTVLLLQEGEYEYFVPVRRLRPTLAGRLGEKTGMRKSLRKSSYYKVGF